jgi:misacylated tRNA(Ala) deacylase
LQTVVVNASVPEARPQTAKKNRKAAADVDEPVLYVVLHDTVLFPEGGGQPSDIGVLSTADDKLWQVLEVKRVGGQAIHSVRPTSDTNFEDAIKTFSAGAEVTVSLGEDGFKRRLDHVRTSYFGATSAHGI